MPAHRTRRLGAFSLLVTVGIAAASGAASAPAAGSRLAADSLQASSKIAYVSIPRAPGPQPNATVYVMQADGSGRRPLARNVWPDAASWSPDGRRLAFVRGFGAPEKGPGHVNTEVYVMNVDGSAERRLTRNGGYDFFPAWSPDGRRIAFVRGRGGEKGIFDLDLYVMNVDGGGERRLARVAGSPAAWSPDGRKLAFVGRDGIYVTNADGSRQRNLTRDASYEDSPAWSPDGRKIAFVRHGRCCPAKADLYIMNADGSGKRRLVYPPAGESLSSGVAWISAPPTWSPDGRKIAFDRAYQPYPKTPGKRFFYRTEIHVMNVDGSGRRRLTDGIRPLWSPDGQKILFARRGPVIGGLYVMNADGGGQRRLARGDASLAAWSPAAR